MFRLTAHYQVHDLAKDRIAELLVEPVLEIAYSGGFEKDFDEDIVSPGLFFRYSDESLKQYDTFILHTLSLADITGISEKLSALKKSNIIILCHNARSLSNVLRCFLSLSGRYRHKRENWLLFEDVIKQLPDNYKEKIAGNCFIAPELLDIFPFEFLKKPLLHLNALAERKFQDKSMMIKFAARNFIVFNDLV